MVYKSEPITSQLRAAREEARISQRELSARSGLTQSHISQIERGAMEPGLSSLIDLARALELELVLVPKKLMPAVKGVVGNAAQKRDLSPETGKTALAVIERGERLVAEQSKQFGSSAEMDRIGENLRFFRQVPVQSADVAAITKAVEMVRLFFAGAHPDARKMIDRDLQALRNRLAHTTAAAPRSAYSIKDDND